MITDTVRIQDDLELIRDRYDLPNQQEALHHAVRTLCDVLRSGKSYTMLKVPPQITKAPDD